MISGCTVHVTLNKCRVQLLEKKKNNPALLTTLKLNELSVEVPQPLDVLGRLPPGPPENYLGKLIKLQHLTSKTQCPCFRLLFGLCSASVCGWGKQAFRDTHTKKKVFPEAGEPISMR